MPRRLLISFFFVLGHHFNLVVVTTITANLMSLFQGVTMRALNKHRRRCLVVCKSFIGIFDDDSVGIKLTVNYLLAGQCSYCLNDAKKEISYISEILFVPQNEAF